MDDWIAARALQNQAEHLSTSKVLIDQMGHVAGYYTLAIGQVDFGDLPPDLARCVPRPRLPGAVLAWPGVSERRQGQGLGRLLLAQALRD